MPPTSARSDAEQRTSVSDPAVPVWRDPAVPPAARVDALIADMSIEEKLAQLGSVWPGVENVSGNVAPMQEVFGRHQDFDEATGHGVGHLTRPFGTRPVTADDGAERLADLQQTLQTRTRLGIPALVHEECLTGFTSYQATVYPTAIAWAATFDPDLVTEMAAAIGRDMAALGVHQGLVPRGRRRARLPLGAGRGDASARTPTSSAGSAAPTSEASRAAASSPPSSTSPATPHPRELSTTGPSPWGRASSRTTSCPRSNTRSATARSAAS